jgi:hypothetical protein
VLRFSVCSMLCWLRCFKGFCLATNWILITCWPASFVVVVIIVVGCIITGYWYCCWHDNRQDMWLGVR